MSVPITKPAAAATDLSPRIQRLREQVIRATSTICVERARIYTAMYQKHEAQPVILKRAFALAETLKQMTIFINDGELIVGNQSSQVRAAPIFPEYAVEWILKELDDFEKRPGDTFYPSDAVKSELKEICAYWHGKTTLEKGRALMPEAFREIHEAGIIRAEGNLTSGDAHIAVNMEKVLKLGIQGYLDKVEFKRQQLDPTVWADVKKEQFYRAVAISLKAMQDFMLRYADVAASLRASEPDPARQAELERISLNCKQIAQYPPQDFYQALQLTYFVQLALQIESNGHSLSLGRMDQYLYPFYKQDRFEEKITDEFVMELLENTWIKLLSIHKIRSWSHTRYSAGSPLYQNVTIGGQTVEGEDAVNELSYLILRSVGATKLTQPNLSVRFHKHLSDDFLLECLHVIEKGFGMPAFNNDEIVIPAFIKLSVAKEDAYNYSAIGCIEVAVPGKWGYRCTGMHFLNFMRVLLAALNDGQDTMSGKTFCKGIGKLTDFAAFDDVLRAWRQQVAYYTKVGVAIDTAIDTVLEEEAPDILCSAFVDDCLKRGLTIKAGGSKYDFVSGLQVGIANLGNSLAAIKKLVFEDRRISQAELAEHLAQNFAGAEGEKTRQLLLNYAPKYGNDDNYVDMLLREAYMDYIHELQQYHTTRYGRGPIGCHYYAGTSSISANVPSGAVVPATPDGRKAFAPLAEGSSPSSGTDVCGPTAVFKSVAKLPTNKILGGVLLNQKLAPATIKHEKEKQKLIAMLRTFFSDLKGWHVQYNIVNREILLAAQKDPEQYRDLIVRVAGYSAFFTVLAPEMQNDIIARTEHAL